MHDLKKKPDIVLGFDFGMKRIGVAIGQTLTLTANPLTILSAKDGVPDWNVIKKMKENWKVTAFVVGLPFNMDGTEQLLTKLARRFGRKLQGRFNLPLFFVDERLTTQEAIWNLRDKRKHDQKEKKYLDDRAAQIILEAWLKDNKGEMSG